jgi:hypothetical protein
VCSRATSSSGDIAANRESNEFAIDFTDSDTDTNHADTDANTFTNSDWSTAQLCQ